MSSELTQHAMRNIQSGLAALGHAPGALDGRWGPRTRSAMESLIAARGKAVEKAPNSNSLKTILIRQGVARHPVREIIVHCSATRPKWMEGRPFVEQVAEIRRWHVLDNGWSDIGYHHLIGRGGEHSVGRPESVVGAHVSGRNNGTIGICLIGGHGSTEHDRFSDHFTPTQERTLLGLIDAIASRTAIDRITGHNHYAAKACPGFQVPSWLATVRRGAMSGTA